MSTNTAAQTDASETEEDEGPEKSRKKLFIVIGAALVVLLGVGGYLGMGMMAGPAAPAPDPKTVAGLVVTLAPITLNLADGRYLKLTLALQLSEEASPVAGSPEAAAAGGAPAVDGSKALDSAISVLGQRTYGQLLAPGGRSSAQKVLSVAVKKRYEGKVLGVYFTEFLMQ